VPVKQRLGTSATSRNGTLLNAQSRDAESIPIHCCAFLHTSVWYFVPHVLIRLGSCNAKHCILLYGNVQLNT